MKCKIELWLYEEALADATYCLKLDNGKLKGYEMEVKCHIAFGDLVKANACLTHMFTMFRGTEFVTSKTRLIQKLMTLNKDYLRYVEKGDYHSALNAINDLIDHMYRSISHRLFKAHVLNKLREYERAEKIAKTVLEIEPKNLTAQRIIQYAQLNAKQAKIREEIDRLHSNQRRLEQSRKRPIEKVNVRKEGSDKQRHCEKKLRQSSVEKVSVHKQVADKSRQHDNMFRQPSVEEVAVGKPVAGREHHCGQKLKQCSVEVVSVNKQVANNERQCGEKSRSKNSKVDEKVGKDKDLEPSIKKKCDTELQVVYDGYASKSLQKSTLPEKQLPKLTEVEPVKSAKLLLIEKTKEKATEAFKALDFRKSYDLYMYALSIDPSNKIENAKLHFNKSVVALKLGNVKEAIDSCSKAIHLNPGYFKAYLRRAKLNLDSKHFKDAIMDYEAVIRLKPEKGLSRNVEYKPFQMK
ncbi:dnaJ subfamily C member 7-like protein [Leptotrombidium deliense]|uniref:DnaJ subfamily C member 7-like protein n=1 Tax=Leptotrombidium deliense TaxID=299467 RepID=A0A443SGY2_9ACAR|nr:dnaJ subfamily C member 7-like protein [Leptotrombidium deliense]